MGARQHLAANLKRLMDAPDSRYPTAKSVEDATARLDKKIGRSTVQRIREAATPVNLDYVEALGLVFGLEPWQLLAPAGAMTSGEPDFEGLPPSIEAAITRLAELFGSLDDLGREFAIPMLTSLAKNPEQAKKTVEMLETLARVHARPVPKQEPRASPDAKKKIASVAGEKRPRTKAALVLKIGGGQNQQFTLPLSRSAFRTESAPANERAWYDRVKAVPKADAG